jgi:CBS domain-containing protein
MLTNPLWRAPLAEFRQHIRGWIYGAEADGPMHLAIFMDAVSVAGDPGLLHQAKQFMHEALPDNDAFLARFASAVEQFNEPAGWWARLTAPRGRDEQLFDLKKLGTFPIVHGVRSLALRDHVRATATAARLEALVAGGRLPDALANELMDSLNFMMGLKLKAGLTELEAQCPVSGAVRIDRLGSLERDLLRDALAVVKRFKALVRHQFMLEAA